MKPHEKVQASLPTSATASHSPQSLLKRFSVVFGEIQVEMQKGLRGNRLLDKLVDVSFEGENSAFAKEYLEEFLNHYKRFINTALKSLEDENNHVITENILLTCCHANQCLEKLFKLFAIEEQSAEALICLRYRELYIERAKLFKKFIAKKYEIMCAYEYYSKDDISKLLDYIRQYKIAMSSEEHLLLKGGGDLSKAPPTSKTEAEDETSEVAVLDLNALEVTLREKLKEENPNKELEQKLVSLIAQYYIFRNIAERILVLDTFRGENIPAMPIKTINKLVRAAEQFNSCIEKMEKESSQKQMDISVTVGTETLTVVSMNILDHHILAYKMIYEKFIVIFQTEKMIHDSLGRSTADAFMFNSTGFEDLRLVQAALPPDASVSAPSSSSAGTVGTFIRDTKGSVLQVEEILKEYKKYDQYEDLDPESAVDQLSNRFTEAEKWTNTGLSNTRILSSFKLPETAFKEQKEYSTYIKKFMTRYKIYIQEIKDHIKLQHTQFSKLHLYKTWENSHMLVLEILAADPARPRALKEYYPRIYSEMAQCCIESVSILYGTLTKKDPFFHYIVEQATPIYDRIDGYLAKDDEQVVADGLQLGEVHKTTLNKYLTVKGQQGEFTRLAVVHDDRASELLLAVKGFDDLFSKIKCVTEMLLKTIYEKCTVPISNVSEFTLICRGVEVTLTSVTSLLSVALTKAEELATHVEYFLKQKSFLSQIHLYILDYRSICTSLNSLLQEKLKFITMRKLGLLFAVEAQLNDEKQQEEKKMAEDLAAEIERSISILEERKATLVSKITIILDQDNSDSANCETLGTYIREFDAFHEDLKLQSQTYKFDKSVVTRLTIKSELREQLASKATGLENFEALMKDIESARGLTPSTQPEKKPPTKEELARAKKQAANAKRKKLAKRKEKFAAKMANGHDRHPAPAVLPVPRTTAATPASQSQIAPPAPSELLAPQTKSVVPAPQASPPQSNSSPSQDVKLTTLPVQSSKNNQKQQSITNNQEQNGKGVSSSHHPISDKTQSDKGQETSALKPLLAAAPRRRWSVSNKRGNPSTTAVAAQVTPQVTSQLALQATPRVAPQAPPLLTPQVAPQTATQPAPQASAQATSQIPPLLTPRVVSQTESQPVLPQPALPPTAPQPVTRTEKERGEPVDEKTVQEAFAQLPPVQPKPFLIQYPNHNHPKNGTKRDDIDTLITQAYHFVNLSRSSEGGFSWELWSQAKQKFGQAYTMARPPNTNQTKLSSTFDHYYKHLCFGLNQALTEQNSVTQSYHIALKSQKSEMTHQYLNTFNRLEQTARGISNEIRRLGEFWMLWQQAKENYFQNSTAASMGTNPKRAASTLSQYYQHLFLGLNYAKTEFNWANHNLQAAKQSENGVRAHYYFNRMDQIQKNIESISNEIGGVTPKSSVFTSKRYQR